MEVPNDDIEGTVGKYALRSSAYTLLELRAPSNSLDRRRRPRRSTQGGAQQRAVLSGRRSAAAAS